jgi:hypothetical protein
MYHQTPNTDPEKVKTALWNLIKNGSVSQNVFVSNRPAVSTNDDFVVVDVNGAITDFDGYARCVCMVQLFARDIDNVGTANMVKLSSMYDTLISILPYNVKPYTFSKKNQVGRRDSLGFHATIINLECIIYS